MVIDRDFTPDVPKRFRVNAYPSLLVLGPELENIHRWKGFSDTDFLESQFQEGLRRFELFQSGKEWLETEPRAETVIDADGCRSYPVPARGRIRGIAPAKKTVWILQGSRVHELERSGSTGVGEATGRTISLSGKGVLVGLCADDRHLYVATYGWTRGHPIYRYRLKDLEPDGTIVTEANKTKRVHATSGIARGKRDLYVLEGRRRRVNVVDPTTGRIERDFTVAVDGYYCRNFSSLYFDGRLLVTSAHLQKLNPGQNRGKQDRSRPLQPALIEFDPKVGQIRRIIEVNYPLASVAKTKRDHFLVSELEVRGFDRNHKPIVLHPAEYVLHAFRYRGR